jgi:Abortive infection C-terminus
LADYSRLPSPEVLRKHIERINANAERDPAAAIGSCKELVESTCKFILDDYEVRHSNKDDLLSLYKKTADVLKLSAESVPDGAKGSQRALRSMATTVQALAELRNELGLGHGRTTPSPALGRHAKLTVQLTRGVVEFLLDTWHVRRAGEVA